MAKRPSNKRSNKCLRKPSLGSSMTSSRRGSIRRPSTSTIGVSSDDNLPIIISSRNKDEFITNLSPYYPENEVQKLLESATGFFSIRSEDWNTFRKKTHKTRVLGKPLHEKTKTTNYGPNRGYIGVPPHTRPGFLEDPEPSQIGVSPENKKKTYVNKIDKYEKGKNFKFTSNYDKDNGIENTFYKNDKSGLIYSKRKCPKYRKANEEDKDHENKVEINKQNYVKTKEFVEKYYVSKTTSIREILERFDVEYEFVSYNKKYLEYKIKDPKPGQFEGVYRIEINDKVKRKSKPMYNYTFTELYDEIIKDPQIDRTTNSYQIFINLMKDIDVAKLKKLKRPDKSQIVKFLNRQHVVYYQEPNEIEFKNIKGKGKKSEDELVFKPMMVRYGKKGFPLESDYDFRHVGLPVGLPIEAFKMFDSKEIKKPPIKHKKGKSIKPKVSKVDLKGKGEQIDDYFVNYSDIKVEIISLRDEIENTYFTTKDPAIKKQYSCFTSIFKQKYNEEGKIVDNIKVKKKGKKSSKDPLAKYLTEEYILNQGRMFYGTFLRNCAFNKIMESSLALHGAESFNIYMPQEFDYNDIFFKLPSKKYSKSKDKEILYFAHTESEEQYLDVLFCDPYILKTNFINVSPNVLRMRDESDMELTKKWMDVVILQILYGYEKFIDKKTKEAFNEVYKKTIGDELDDPFDFYVKLSDSDKEKENKIDSIIRYNQSSELKEMIFSESILTATKELEPLSCITEIRSEDKSLEESLQTDEASSESSYSKDESYSERPKGGPSGRR